MAVISTAIIITLWTCIRGLSYAHSSVKPFLRINSFHPRDNQRWRNQGSECDLPNVLQLLIAKTSSQMPAPLIGSLLPTSEISKCFAMICAVWCFLPDEWNGLTYSQYLGIIFLGSCVSLAYILVHSPGLWCPWWGPRYPRVPLAPAAPWAHPHGSERSMASPFSQAVHKGSSFLQRTDHSGITFCRLLSSIWCSFFFFFLILFIYLFIYGCIGSSFLCEGFL